jgi:hypothetical protein
MIIGLTIFYFYRKKRRLLITHTQKWSILLYPTWHMGPVSLKRVSKDKTVDRLLIKSTQQDYNT